MLAVGSVYDAPEDGFYIRLYGGASLLSVGGKLASAHDIYYLGSDDLKEMIHNITKYNEWWEYIRKNSVQEFDTLKELKKDFEEEGLYDEEEWAEEREEYEIEQLNLNFCYDAYVFLNRGAEAEAKEEEATKPKMTGVHDGGAADNYRYWLFSLTCEAQIAEEDASELEECVRHQEFIYMRLNAERDGYDFDWSLYDMTSSSTEKVDFDDYARDNGFTLGPNEHCSSWDFGCATDEEIVSGYDLSEGAGGYYVIYEVKAEDEGKVWWLNPQHPRSYTFAEIVTGMFPEIVEDGAVDMNIDLAGCARDIVKHPDGHSDQNIKWAEVKVKEDEEEEEEEEDEEEGSEDERVCTCCEEYCSSIGGIAATYKDDEIAVCVACEDFVFFCKGCGQVKFNDLLYGENTTDGEVWEACEDCFSEEEEENPYGAAEASGESDEEEEFCICVCDVCESSHGDDWIGCESCDESYCHKCNNFTSKVGKENWRVTQRRMYPRLFEEE